MTDKPKRPVIRVKGQRHRKEPRAPEQVVAQQHAPKLKGPAYTPPRQPVPRMDRFWLVMRDSGRRPRVRHASLEEARQEAQRIAARCPGAQVWVIECQTVETIREAGAS